MDVLRGPRGLFLLFVQVPLIQVVFLWCGLDVFLSFICLSFLPPFFFFYTVLHVIARSRKSAEVSVEQKSGFVFVGITTSCVCHSLGGVRYLVKRVRSPAFVVAEAYVQAY